MKMSMWSGVIFITLLLVVFGGVVSAKEIQATSATGSDNVALYVSANDSINLDGVTLEFNWDSDIMNVTSIGPLVDTSFWQVNPATPIENGYTKITWLNQTSFPAGNYTLFRFICNAQVTNGSSTPFNITIIKVTESGVRAAYTTVNGTFTTTDTVPPVVTITSPADGATVPDNVTIIANITDVGGVDQGSIGVSVAGEAAIIHSYLPITNGYMISAYRDNVSTGVQTINVSANDLAGNFNSSEISVTVAQSGVTITAPTNGTYTNETQPSLTASFVQVTGTSVKMFLNGADITLSCDKTGGATDGAISLNYTTYGAMADGAYTLLVNGTSSLDASVQSDSVWFYKDTVAPVVTVTNVQDSDGDGFPEASEELTFSYTAVDPTLALVWIGSSTNTSAVGTLSYNTNRGNRNVTVSAIDLAGNTNESAPVHLFNDYIAYITDESLGEFAGLNLSKTAVFDYFDTARSVTFTGPDASMTPPTLGTFTKNITGGSNVTLDDRANDPVTSSELPAQLDFFTTPVLATLDFNIQVENVTNATLFIAKANSSLVNQLSQNHSRSSVSTNTIQELLSQKQLVMYGHDSSGTTYGYTTIDASDPNNLVQKNPRAGAVSFSSILSQNINNNYLNLDAGFNTATAPGTAGNPLDVSQLEEGEYVLVAVCNDADRIGVITFAPFIVAKEGKAISPSQTVYGVGEPAVVTTGTMYDTVAGILLKQATYTGDIRINLTTLGTSSLESLKLYGDGNSSNMRKLGNYNIWISDGYGYGGYGRNATSASINTTGLLPGDYIVYMMAENLGNVTVFNQTNVTIVSAVTANFTGTPTSGSAPLTVDFTDLSASGITSWNWTFGDGENASIQNPSHIYATGGNYSVTLNVSDGHTTSEITRANYIQVYPVLVANFSGTPRSGTVPLSVQFTDLSVGNVTDWSWSFGDGGTAVTQNPLHVFSAAGTYSVRLTVNDNYSNATITKAGYITVASSGGGGGGGGGGSGGSASGFIGFVGSEIVYETTGGLSVNWDGYVDQTTKIVTPDGDMSIIVPAGTKAKNAAGGDLRSVTIEAVGDVPAAPGGFMFAGKAIKCTPEGATFDPAAKISFDLTEEEWAALGPGQTFTIMGYNAVSGKWEQIPTTLIPGSRRVIGEVSHFSTYGLFITGATGPVVTTPTTVPTSAMATVPTTTATPGFGFIVAMVGLGAVGLSFLRRK